MLIIFPDVIDQAELYNNYSKTISHGPTQTHTDKFFFPAGLGREKAVCPLGNKKYYILAYLQ